MGRWTKVLLKEGLTKLNYCLGRERIPCYDYLALEPSLTECSFHMSSMWESIFEDWKFKFQSNYTFELTPYSSIVLHEETESVISLFLSAEYDDDDESSFLRTLWQSNCPPRWPCFNWRRPKCRLPRSSNPKDLCNMFIQMNRFVIKYDDRRLLIFKDIMCFLNFFSIVLIIYQVGVR